MIRTGAGRVPGDGDSGGKEAGRIRVLYSFPDRLGGAGIGTIAFHQVRGAIDQGFDVILYCTSIHRELVGVNRIVKTLSVGGVRIPHRAFGRERSYRYHDWRVSLALQRLKGIDVVHCWPKACIQTFKMGRRLDIKTVREVPNTHTAYAFEAVAREMEKLGLKPLAGHSHTYVPEVLVREQEEYRLADRLLIPSDFSRRTFLQRGVPPEKLELHQYGFDPRCFFPSVDGKAAATSERPLRALFAGRCEARKGLHYALEAWLASGVAERGGRFVICGDFVPGYRSALGPRLEHPSVEIRGFVGDLGAVMRESDIFVFPSIEEGSALVTYEAQACGCVLVVSDAAGARCVHGTHGLVHSAGDVPTLTEHIQLLDRDRTLLGRLREGALSASRGLTWGRAAEELAGVYRRLVITDRPTRVY